MRAARLVGTGAWLMLCIAGPPAYARDGAPPAHAKRLSFGDLLVSTVGGYGPSATVRSLTGVTVAIAGYMARMESQPDGTFYLCARPVTCTEEGGGTADLPPETIRVVVPSLKNRQLGFVPGRLEVTGRLELGHFEADTAATFITVTLASDVIRTPLETNKRQN